MQLACKVSRAYVKAFLSIKQTKTNRKKERQTNETKRLFVLTPNCILQQVTHYKQNVLAILNSILMYSRGLLIHGISLLVANTFIFNELLVKNDVGCIKQTSKSPS